MAGCTSYLPLLLLWSSQGLISTATIDSQSNRRHWETSGQNKTDKLVCYYPLPDSSAKMAVPDDLDPMLCTHVIFIPSSISPSCEIVPTYPFHLDFFAKVIPAIKKQNPALKVLLSNGGGAYSGFAPVLRSEYNMSRYVNSSVRFLRKYGFDGLDLDWEFPGWNGQPYGQRHNFSVITVELRRRYEEEARQTKRARLLLTAAVAAGKLLLVIYEYNILAKSLDYVNLMGYDYNNYSPLWPFVFFNCPLHPESYDKDYFVTNNLAWSAEEWVRRGVPREKMIIGVPTYIHTYTLLFERFTKPGSPARGTGQCDQCGYTLPCQMLQQNGTRVFDDSAKVPYVYRGDQWVSYDDVQSLTIKSQWIKDQGFGGVMVFTMSDDDVHGVCDGKTKYPLLKAIRKVLFGA